MLPSPATYTSLQAAISASIDIIHKPNKDRVKTLSFGLKLWNIKSAGCCSLNRRIPWKAVKRITSCAFVLIIIFTDAQSIILFAAFHGIRQLKEQYFAHQKDTEYLLSESSNYVEDDEESNTMCLKIFNYFSALILK